jgi:hypothetical protein
VVSRSSGEVSEVGWLLADSRSCTLREMTKTENCAGELWLET